MSELLPVLKWSTDHVDAGQRLDYYADALNCSIVPMQLDAPGQAGFYAHMDAVELGGLSVIHQRGSEHRCYTGQRDLARNGGHYYHLILNRACGWRALHRGAVQLAPGEALFIDSRFATDIQSPSAYDYIHVKLNAGWVRQWLPVPAVMTGAKLGAQAGWGQVLCAFAAGLTPQFLAQSSQRVSQMVDHLGSLLALTAQEYGTPAPREPAAEPIEKIRDLMQQMCASPALTAAQVAAAAGMPLRSFHRTFTRAQSTFGGTLTQMRYQRAVDMLGSPLCKRLSIAEIANRAGFCDASHLSAVVRSRSGQTPSQIRRHALCDAA